MIRLSFQCIFPSASLFFACLSVFCLSVCLLACLFVWLVVCDLQFGALVWHLFYFGCRRHDFKDVLKTTYAYAYPYAYGCADGKEQTERDWSAAWLEYPNLANSANVLEATAAQLPYSISPLQLGAQTHTHNQVSLALGPLSNVQLLLLLQMQ